MQLLIKLLDLVWACHTPKTFANCVCVCVCVFCQACLALNICYLTPPLHTCISFPLLLTSSPAERLCQAESIKTVHLTEKSLFEVCVGTWGFIMCFVCLCVRYVCVHRGRGSPGDWQYGALVLHTPLVKMLPMGLGQLWPTYTASWAITSLMTHIHLHTYYSNPGNSVWLSVLVLSVCQEQSLCLSFFDTWKISPYLALFLMQSLSQVKLPSICEDIIFFSYFSFIQPTLSASHTATRCPGQTRLPRGELSACVKGVTFLIVRKRSHCCVFYENNKHLHGYIHTNVMTESLLFNFIYLTVTRWWDTFS